MATIRAARTSWWYIVFYTTGFLGLLSWNDELFLFPIFSDKLSLADMVPLSTRSPNFVVERSLLLAFCMGIDTVWVETWIEFARRSFSMGEVAIGAGATSAIAAERHIGTVGILVSDGSKHIYNEFVCRRE